MGHPRGTSLNYHKFMPSEPKSSQKSQLGSNELDKSTRSSTSSSSTPKEQSFKRLDPRHLPVLTPPAENFLSHTYKPVSPASASTSTSNAMSSDFDCSTTRYGSASGTDSASTPSSRPVCGSNSVRPADADLHDDKCHFASSPELRMLDSLVSMLTQDYRNGGQGSGAQR